MIFPSRINYIRDNLTGPIKWNHDVIISNDYLDIVASILRKPGKPSRKIYLARGPGPRSVVNESEIIDYLKLAQFEIVYTGSMTFAEQQDLFSEAKIIIGPTGASFANMLLAPPHCTILVFVSNNARTNFHFMDQLALHCDHQLTYMIGEEIPPQKNTLHQAHNDYRINIDDIKIFVDQLS